MNLRSPIQPYLSNSLAIRQEIQRFESVHPSIYAIYDLIEAIQDPLIQQQVREHVVCIEDSFVNSQEWTLSRAVPDLKLGILGSVQSGKSALVHRYLTGSYMQEESPEGGRFKKEVMLDAHSYLLLIRDEGGPPEMQFTQWVDAVIFVFSLENEMSFQAVYSYYAKMAHYRNPTEIPLILVGTQDAISESNPRVIDDVRARKLAIDLKRCTYYETCATYGLNVERVFQDACQKIVQTRYPQILASVSAAAAGTSTTSTSASTLPSTPNHSQRTYFQSKPYDSHSTSSQSTSSSGTLVTTTGTPNSSAHSLAQISGSSSKDLMSREKDMREKGEKGDRRQKEKSDSGPPSTDMQLLNVPLFIQDSKLDFRVAPGSTPVAVRKNKRTPSVHKSNSFSGASDLRQPPTPSSTPILGWKNKIKSNSLTGKMDKFMMDFSIHNSSPFTPLLTRMAQVRSSLVIDRPEGKDLPTPSSTPTQSRKNRRRSNLFNKKDDEKKLETEKLGSGRVIPIKQGYLYKRSHGLNKEWKKKYVALLDDGRLTYHPSLHDYMDEVHGKEINLVRTTVKIPGLRPKGSRGISTNPSVMGPASKSTKEKENVMLTAYDGLRDGQQRLQTNMDDAIVISNSSITPGDNKNIGSKTETPNVKKRHRRAKSGGLKSIDPSQLDDSDGYEFIIVSLDSKQWHFEAQSVEERDEWVSAIEQQILSSLQANESCKAKNTSATDPASIQAIRNVRGNNCCTDCGATNPDWASINLGALICIECSGIHRNLGTHLSRVRSLDLDEWPVEHIQVMTSIGNIIVNSVWEASLKGRSKPGVNASREDREKWIRAKYECKEFLPPPPYVDIPLNQQLIDALVREDIRNIILLLGHARAEDINAPYSKDDGRTALHIAAALGNVVFVQLLLWYNANVKVLDHEGRNALWYARGSGSPECVTLLLTNGCPEHPTLPRRRGSVQPGKTDMFDKLPASVI
ncbi:arf-GAP with GTPase, ANK repeat and PH domain-containing protein 1 isoform X5 [Octopus sinensis]|uniref:Arf-GAP with GTPase, ANK repeat and PH domain-containing protein 1 isoform X5 n=1 Tax=Octopus sinensis TaxID=2607531 RepID=A0A7E6FG48_9MOLL|nr:arf-GAP with GTPase, ANK repeat and PH domain-containing protein 1 isoform X5 [Octopus sinensis]